MIPERLAKILTFPEIVTEANKEKLKKLVINGPYIYPGAVDIVPKDKDDQENVYVLAINQYNRRKKADDLRVGDIVDRHI